MRGALLLTALVACSQFRDASASDLIAKFLGAPADGSTGTVTFADASTNVSARTNVSIVMEEVPSGEYKYHVHATGVTLNDCTAASTGGHFNPLGATGACDPAKPAGCELGDLSGKHGTMQTANMMYGRGDLAAAYSDVHLPLSGANTIEGRSVVFHRKTTDAKGVVSWPRVSCATILRAPTALAPTNVAAATFKGATGVWGTLQLRQTADVRTNVKFALAGLPDGAYSYHVHVGAVPADGACAGTGGHFNPLKATTGCSRTTPLLCETGDLGGKHGKLVSKAGIAETFYTDDKLPLDKGNPLSVLGRSIVVHKPTGERLLCATIERTPVALAAPRVATATFKGAAMAGTIKLEQTADITTKMTVSLTGLTAGVYKYHVHQNPLNAAGSCAADSAGGHWNPTSMPPAGKACATASPEFCEVGDLSGKFGTVTIADAKNVVSVTVVDATLPLAGRDSVAGRSIVFHKQSADGKSWPRVACANIVKAPTALAQKSYAVANFDKGGVSGSVTFTQTHDTQTAVAVKLSGVPDLGPGCTKAPCPRGYHIHTLAVSRSYRNGAGEMVNVPDRKCSEVGGHFDPRKADIAKCTTVATIFCAVGDLAGAHGNLKVASKMLSTSYTDNKLMLSGSEPIIGRSVVVHEPDGTPKWCADVIVGVAPAAPKVKETVASVDFDQSGVTGKISFVQRAGSDGEYAGSATAVTLSFSGLPAGAYTYHVHATAVQTAGSCGAASTGGHWNPLKATNTPPCSKAWPRANCEVGDLSGKHGPLQSDGKQATATAYYDGSLPLSGSSSIVGKSVVLHKYDAGTKSWPRYICGSVALGRGKMQPKGDNTKPDPSWLSTITSDELVTSVLVVLVIIALGVVFCCATHHCGLGNKEYTVEIAMGGQKAHRVTQTKHGGDDEESSPLKGDEERGLD